MSIPVLLSVPNVSEGRDRSTVAAIGAAFGQAPSRLLDIHSDADHHRSVFSLAGAPGTLAYALLAGAAEAVARIDLTQPRGLHPHVGAVDVVPLVYLHVDEQGAACAEALLAADLISESLRLPVFFYGELAGGRSRAELRRGGLVALSERMRSGELAPDFGPSSPHPTAGVTLVGARAPLVAFNLELAPPADLRLAQRIAARIREGGSEGLPGVRAIGLELASRGGLAQVSMNVEDPLTLTLAEIVHAVARHAEVAAGELVGLAPRAALAGFPPDLDMGDFDPSRHILEEALRSM
jgi:glutamate formiminotransferase